MSDTERSPDPALASLKALIEHMARALVDDSDSVVVNQIAGSESVIYEISVAPSDQGKIVGREGRNLAAIQVLAAAVGTKLGWKPRVELIEPL